MAIRNLVELTATYGKSLQATKIPGQFTLRIYTGGLAGSDAADEHAAREFETFKADHLWSSYEIHSRQSRWFPSCYDYTAQFRR